MVHIQPCASKTKYRCGQVNLNGPANSPSSKVKVKYFFATIVSFAMQFRMECYFVKLFVCVNLLCLKFCVFGVFNRISLNYSLEATLMGSLLLNLVTIGQ